MIDAALAVDVLGVIVIAIAIDVAVMIGWIRRRWR
jgi:hypothetical protein